jgi:hypothetical protein
VLRQGVSWARWLGAIRQLARLRKVYSAECVEG